MPRKKREDGKKENHEVFVVSYGTPTGWDIPEEAKEQIWLGHQVRNALVELHQQGYEVDKEAVWDTFPTVKRAKEVVAQAQAAYDDIAAKVKDERVEDRTTAARKITKASLTLTKKALGEAKKSVRAEKEAYYPYAKQQFESARNQKREDVKKLYAEWVTKRGLYWATFNDIAEHHQTAVSQIAKRRANGDKAELHFKRFNGEGTLAVQLQREQGNTGRTAELLASSEGKWKNVMQLSPWIDPTQWDAMTRSEQRQITRISDEEWKSLSKDERRNVGHGYLLFTIGGKKPLIRVPLVIHRMLPADADVIGARIARRIVAGTPVVTVSITARIPPSDHGAVSGKSLISLHVGWRSLGDDGVRVGMIGVASMPTIPEKLSKFLHPIDDQHIEIRLPRQLVWIVGRPSSIRSKRDVMLDDIKKVIIEAGNEYPFPEDVDTTHMSNWRSPARVVKLLKSWPPPEASQELIEQLAAWYKRERHLWSYEANERKQITGHIKHTYREIAAWICSFAGAVVTDDFRISSLITIPKLGVEDDRQAKAARAIHQLVSPGLLRSSLTDCAKRNGVLVEAAKLEGRGLVHGGCGTSLMGQVQFAEHVNIWCNSCNQMFDQDANVCDHLRQIASERFDND